MADENPTVPDPTPADPAPPAPVPAPSPTGAADIVLAGKKTERELKLEKDLRDREIRAAELEDENRSLKQALQPPPAPKPQPKKSPWTYFDE